jgi:hypothetical protein
MSIQVLRLTRFVLTVGLLLLPVVLKAAVFLPGGILQAGLQGASYSTAVPESGGVAPFVWTVNGVLPDGLSLDTSTGVISGIPTQPSTFAFTLLVSDSTGSAAQNDYQITINPAPTGIQTEAGVCAHIALNGGWSTTLTVANLDLSPILVTVNLWGDTGGALDESLIFPQAGGGPGVTSNVVTRSLDVGGSLVIEVDGDTALGTIDGWAEVASTGHVGAFAIFRQRVTGRPDAEGTAALDAHTQTTLVVPFDNTNGYTTSMAIVNGANLQPTTLSVSTLDENGVAITPPQSIAPLPANGHTSFAIPTMFPATAGRRGVLEFKSTSGTNITALGFRFNPTFNFTSVPVMYPPVQVD